MDADIAKPSHISQTSGLLLAGGRGQRMGGVDKGLQTFRGRALAAQVFERLRPQVGEMFISANRHLDWYARLGAPVLGDEHAAAPSTSARAVDTATPVESRDDAAPPPFEGPLAGMLVGLKHAHGEFLAIAPCDGPFLPTNLVSRLHAALLEQTADIAFACSDAVGGGVDRHYVYALLRTALASDLSHYFFEGGRAVRAWYARHRVTEVKFDDPRCFYNINTADTLNALESSSDPVRGPADKAG